MIIPTLMYHSVEKVSDDYLTVAVNVFDEHMRYLSQNFSVKTASEIITLVKQGKVIPKDTVVISFDDAYENNILYALPYLDKYSLKAMFFVIAQYIGKNNLWNHKSNKIIKHMNSNSIKHLIQSGHEIGNHTLTHQRISKLPKKLIHKELYRSNEIFVKLFNYEPKSLSYPYGDNNEMCLEICRSLFDVCFTTTKIGYFNWRKDMANVRRIFVSPNDKVIDLKNKIACYLGEKQHE